jgi:hypothetical protein
MQRKGLLLALLCILSVSEVWSQERPAIPWRVPVPELQLTGNAQIDFLGRAELVTGPRFQEETGVAIESRRKSPWIAAGLSVVLPGAGEFYAESYYKSAAFFAVELAAWILAYTYDHKGDRQTDFFQNYADQNWSVVRYAQYTQNNLNPPHPPYNWLIPGRAGAAPWDQVNWDELNRMERDIGDYYSHTLPPHGEQQYYELIGKYPQFNMGWNDANPNWPPDYNSMVANITPNFRWYSDERGRANSYYNTASTYVAVAIINHVLSAIDAVWSVSQYNRNLHAEVGFQRVPVMGGMADVPVLKLRYDI